MTDYLIKLTDGKEFRIPDYVGEIDLDKLARDRWFTWTYKDGTVMHVNIAQIIFIKRMG